MDLIQFFTLLGSIVGGIAFIWIEIRSEIKEIRTEAHAQACRTDKLYEKFQSACAEQSARSDRLYEMFIDLVKEKK